MSYSEVWVVMVKRKDGRAYSDMHKCYGSRFWHSEHEAKEALVHLDHHIRDSHHVVPILCCTDEIWVRDRHIKPEGD